MRSRALSGYRREHRRLRRMSHLPILQEGVYYHCPLDLRKRHNLALQRVEGRGRLRFDFSFPHILHVGVTTYCNLRCPACPTGTRALGRPRQHLEYDVFARRVDELRGTLLFMLFWDWGEPLMHPRLVDMIRHARKSSIKTVISSNGTVANSEAQIERLVAAGPDLIAVCVDGATQETYERYRMGGKLSDVLMTLERLAWAKAKQKSARPVVEFRSLATRYNEREMPQLLRLAEETGANFFSVKTLRPYDYRGHDLDDELVPLDQVLARYAYEEDGKRSVRGRIYDAGPLNCGKPLRAPTLNADGDLVFCSYARHAEEKFGDVSSASIKRVWRSRSAREKRLRFLVMRGTRSCERCYFRIAHEPTVLHTVALDELPPDVALERPITKAEFLRVLPAT